MRSSPSPLALVIIYDGECSFCRRQVERIRRWSDVGTFEFIPSQMDGLEQRFPQLNQQDFNTGMRLIFPDGRVAVGAEAGYQIARRLLYWRWFAWLYQIPGMGWVGRKIYAWISTNRHRLG